jgi:hypothetical protein
MGSLKNYKSHALVVYKRSKTNKEGNKEPDHKKRENLKSIEESYKEGKLEKEKSKCNYCNRRYHQERSCMKNTIYLMEQALYKSDIQDCILENAKKNPGENPLEDQGKGHALISIYSSPNTWI